MEKIKFISHEKVSYPLFPSLRFAFDFFSSKYDSFEVDEVYWLTDFCHSDGKYYWLVQIFFDFIENDERISDCLVVCVPDD